LSEPSQSGTGVRSVAKSLLRDCLLDPDGQTARPPELRAREAALNLRGAEASLMDSCLRLRRAERALAKFVKERRHRPERAAVRQVERERLRLGRELHTGVGQLLAAIRMQSELVSARLTDPESSVTMALERIGVLVREALEQVRSISSRMYPPAWQQTPLEDALRRLWLLSGIPERFEAVLHIGQLDWEPDLELKILIYRAAQEGFSNIARHSQASTVRAAVETKGERLILRIQDDGTGFDPAMVFSSGAQNTSGIGLRTIRDQAESLGGRIGLESGLHGTTLEISVPRSG
jgi:two-component system, NarL family, sensor kinase